MATNIPTPVGVLILISIAVVVLVIPSGDKSPPAPMVEAPAHSVVRTEDVSYGNVRRLNVRVTVPQHYEKSEIEAIARSVVAEITDRQKVNAISVMFFGPGVTTDGAFDVGLVEWAPNGSWGDAHSVRAGDYATFRYHVVHYPPR